MDEIIWWSEDYLVGQIILWSKGLFGRPNYFVERKFIWWAQIFVMLISEHYSRGLQFPLVNRDQQRPSSSQ